MTISARCVENDSFQVLCERKKKRNNNQVKKWFAHYRSEIVDKVAGDKNQLSTHAMTFVAAEHRTRRSQGRG